MQVIRTSKLLLNSDDRFVFLKRVNKKNITLTKMMNFLNLAELPSRIEFDEPILILSLVIAVILQFLKDNAKVGN